MKYPLIALIFLVAGAACVPAHADDHKVFSGYACAPYGTTKASDLLVDLWGVTNLTNAPQRVICPLELDSDAGYTVDTPLVVSASFRTGDRAGTVYCTTYLNYRYSDSGGNSLGMEATASYAGPWKPRWTAGVATMEFTSGGGQMNLLCMLTPKVTLGAIPIFEGGASALESSDYRRMSTSACRPYGITRPADLEYRMGGLKSISARMQYVTCPIVRDGDGPFVYFGHTLTINFGYMSDNTEFSAGVRCGGYETDRALGIEEMFFTETGGSAFPGSWDTGFTYSYPSGPGFEGQVNVRCRLAPQALLYSLSYTDAPYW